MTLAVILFAAWVTLRNPFLGLGVLVAGMAFHNFLIMILLRLGASHLLIRAVQSWKEGILVLLVIIASLRLFKAYRDGRLGRPIPLDWVAGIFFAIMVLYLVLPSSVLHGHSNFQQRLAAFRLVAYMPVLYALGRTLKPSERDLSHVAWIVVGAGAIVGFLGLIELWFVPTRAWLDWGVNEFSAWLGFQYSGPGRLPENFFQTLPDGLYLRRMVSTYLSPLGIAYTGLLGFPIAVVLLGRQTRAGTARLVAIVAFLFLLAGILFSVTRLAMFALGGEVILIALIMRRNWVTMMSLLVIAAIAAVIAIYPSVGPTVDANLVAGGSHRSTIITAGDPSLLEHIKTVIADAKVAARHPLGEGLGSSGSSANRFTANPAANPDYAPGESAILTMFVDTGVLGGLAYLAFYLLGLFESARGLLSVPRGSIESALPMAAGVGGLALIPITLTNDVWGDLSVLFLLWWSIGYSATLAAASRRVPGADPVGAARPAIAPT